MVKLKAKATRVYLFIAGGSRSPARRSTGFTRSRWSSKTHGRGRKSTSCGRCYSIHRLSPRRRSPRHPRTPRNPDGKGEGNEAPNLELGIFSKACLPAVGPYPEARCSSVFVRFHV